MQATSAVGADNSLPPPTHTFVNPNLEIDGLPQGQR